MDINLCAQRCTLLYATKYITGGRGYERVAAVVPERFMPPLMGSFAQRRGDCMGWKRWAKKRRQKVEIGELRKATGGHRSNLQTLRRK